MLGKEEPVESCVSGKVSAKFQTPRQLCLRNAAPGGETLRRCQEFAICGKIWPSSGVLFQTRILFSGQCSYHAVLCGDSIMNARFKAVSIGPSSSDFALRTTYWNAETEL